ncbi:acetate--CoA ligase [Alcaligenes endophyticus]|uniref:Acetyl-coenzyme A synthetase n=1 Tax=Alcaligenes endophyticus TaxID=1929088 RepID=A0ABT8EHS5_9BURK|nr:acetate--CoA ligase [Alcaligenes endophyticus]MCX5592199.1 acetate--CoA ligase [Alcaligenes endophyticus]MDN4120846.1 acetate--CoA ligase [Alcaligenes endophyticus]
MSTASSIESVLTEHRVFPVPEDFQAQASIAGLAQYQALVNEADTDYTAYWAKLAREKLQWTTGFTQTLDDTKAPFYKWFADGELNVSENCLDKHLGTPTEHKTALIFEADDGVVTKLSFRQLYHQVCQFANGLTALGYKVGDRALIYMPMSVQAVVAMQACARLGVTHSVVFGGFSSKSLHERAVDVGASLIITADEQRRGGRSIALKPAVDEAIALGGCDAVRHVIVYARTGAEQAWHDGRDIWWDAVVDGQAMECAPVAVNAEHPLFVLYTSGSTGKPKGVQHSSAGYLLGALLSVQWTFDAKDDDVFWCTADIGWITGHTFITYGPLAAGLTQVVFEGVPTYPNAGRFWEMIQRHQVSIFYTAPTAIRSLTKAAENTPECHPRHYNLSSLRLLGSVGEPINPEAWMWYYENVGLERCPIVDTWWQTETGGHVITPLPGVTPLKPGSCGFAFPGMDVAIVDEAGEEVERGKGGFLVIRKPWPNMIRNIWGDPERFVKSYFPAELNGYYLAGDGAQRDQDGYFWVMGRIDDVLNVSGHRMGTMEVESALVAHELVTEAAVVGRPDATTGEAVVAFVVLSGDVPAGDEAKRIATELRNWVAKEIGPIAKPKEIRFGENLPKTRSGKIMRRLLRFVANGEAITQDVSTLENPAILEQLSDAY